MAIISIGICISENLLLSIGIGLVGIFLHWWNAVTLLKSLSHGRVRISHA